MLLTNERSANSFEPQPYFFGLWAGFGDAGFTLFVGLSSGSALGICSSLFVLRILPGLATATTFFKGTPLQKKHNWVCT